MAEEAERGDRRPTEGADATSRLLEQLLAEGTPVAEIAVRLGISVPDAHARISGAPPGRAAAEGVELPPRPGLAGSPPPEGGAARPARRAPGLPPPGGKAPSPPEPERRGLSRRAFLGLAAAGAVGMAAGGAFWATRGSSAPEPVARPPRPVPVPPTLTPVPPPLAALQPATGVFRELRFEPGQPLAETHGIFFMRTGGEEAGAVTGWQLIEPGDPETLVYRVSAGGRFVAAPGALHDRSTGQSWVWPEDELQLLGFSNEAALFEKVAEPPAPGQAKRARYVLTDDRLEERAQFDLKGTGLPAAPPFFAPGGRRAFLALQQPQHFPALLALDGATGRAAGVLSPQRQSAMQRILFHPAMPASDGESFLMPYSYFHLRSPPRFGYGVSTTFVARLGWEGDRQAITRVPVDRAFVSPDGSLVAGERVLPIRGRNLEEFETTSTVIVMDGKRGRIRYLIRSARLNYGDQLWGGRWLADSSGLVVQSRTGGKEGYSLVSADGSAMEPLPEPPGPTREWLGDRDMRGPAPSPNNPALVAFGRTSLYDRVSDRWLGIDPGDAAPAHEGPWRLTGSEETVLALPHRPHRIFPLLAEIEETHIEQNVPTAGDDA